MKTKKITQISMLISVSVIINIFERYLPSISFLPGAKWGFANIIILVGTMLFGFKDLFLIGFLRVLFGSFIMGTFLSVQFYLSLSGVIASVCVMYFFSKRNMFSFLGISVLGSISSNIIQILIYSFITSFAVLNYLPVLSIFSVLTGSLTGAISLFLQSKLKKITIAN
jgi:heptaprenyl diphosphate synthase